MGNQCTHKKRGRGEERRERGSKRKTDREEGGKEREREDQTHQVEYEHELVQSISPDLVIRWPPSLD